MAEVESTAISHRAEAASLYRQAESARQEANTVRQELAAHRDAHRALESELRGHAIGIRAEADATVEALRMQLSAATDKLKRCAELLDCSQFPVCHFDLPESFEASSLYCS